MKEALAATAADFLDWLRAHGAELSAAGDRLTVSASPGVLTPEIKAAITRHKPALLALLGGTSGHAPHGPDETPLLPLKRRGKLPLSLFQQRLWILYQLRRPEDETFNMVTLWEMPGRDLTLLRRAIEDVVRRHEILRSTMKSVDAEPFAQMLPTEAVTIEVQDLRALPPHQQRPSIETATRLAVTEKFDLACEPPLRWRIFVTGAGELTTQVCADHIAVDEWSFVLLRRELDASLDACAAGTLLPPPALQYADYAAWERRREGGPEAVTDLAWWERRLAGMPAHCTFPADRHGGKPASAAYRVCWDNACTGELRALARACRVTLFMVLLAGLAAVLRAYTGRGDIALGSSLGVRERPELETVIGPIVNVVVLRLDLQDDPSFDELLARARGAVLDAHDHRRVSFETLVARLKPERSLDLTPWFQVSLVMHNAFDTEPSQIYSGGVALDMTWFARETESGLVMTLEYRSDLYEPGTIERLAQHLSTVLREASHDRSRRVSTIPLLTEAERTLVTQGFNATAMTLDTAPLTVQFERQAARTPQAIALRAGGTQLSYDALNRRANRIARHLQGHGAGPGVLVGICLDRSVDLLACLLAVLKTGAAYVPLDPDFPAVRLDFMISHSGLALLAVDGGRPAVLAQSGVPPSGIIDIGADAGLIDALDDGDLEIVPDVSNPAYVIYTSGTTGRPNGVVISHAALANFLGAMLHAPGLSATDRLAAVTTISFDIAGLELYLPILAGASIVLVPRATASDGAALAALLAQEGVTIMQATPATWRLLVEAGWMGADGFTALSGGEALPGDLSAALLDRVGALWNLYGPTETTIWSTASRIEPGPGLVTIGRPIANTRIYIVDATGQPVPVGVPGEIWICGTGVASGYWRNPGLTDAKFLGDPFGRDGQDDRVYRTGDLARWLPDGRIVPMGRLDDQLKLRGQRIEPAEIEAVLRAHPSISEAAVLARGDSPDRQRLVAYIVYHKGRDLTASEVRAHARLSLPDYMVPSAFVTIEVMPRTPNGKSDRRALQDPFKPGGAATSAFVHPAPGAEQVIARIWADVLKVDRVGADDNFFDLGGYSLLALRVASAIHKQTGWRIPAHTLFLQTLRQVAASLHAHEAERRAAE